MQCKLTRTAKSLREWFGKNFPSDQHIEGYEPSGCEHVPKPDPQWVWDKRSLLPLVIWWQNPELNDGFYLYGHCGSGKSALLRNFAAALNIPFYERTVYEGLEFADVLTTVDLVDGSTITSYGLLPQAMGVLGYPGIFNADDVDRADPAFLSGFYEVLQGQPVVTNVGGVDVVKPMRGFCITATGNTALRGDMLGVYNGAKPQDIALMDRFVKTRARYLGKRQEKALLKRVVPNLQPKLIDAMVDVANEFRGAFMGESTANSALPFPMSTRALVRWARLTFAYRGSSNAVYDALGLAFLNGADDDPPTRLAMQKIAEGKLGPAFESGAATPSGS